MKIDGIAEKPEIHEAWVTLKVDPHDDFSPRSDGGVLPPGIAGTPLGRDGSRRDPVAAVSRCPERYPNRYLAVMQPSKPSRYTHPWGDHETPYGAIGGEEGTRRLANAFYDVIEEESPTIRAMLPRNTTKTREKFFMYLSGWLGGPPLYEQKWGHPRLRMRHMPFPIGEDEAVEWMQCMRQAMERAEVDEPLRSFLDERLEPLAQHMRNR